MKKGKRTWLIIGIDILVVVFVYMIFIYYLQPTLLEKNNTHKVSSRLDGIKYEMLAEPRTESRAMDIVFSIENTRADTRTVPIPEGITLLVSDGQKYIYDRSKIAGAGVLELGGEETKSWEHEASYPKIDAGTLYVGYFIDDRRQKQLEVEISSSPQ